MSVWVYVSMREGTHRGRKTSLDPMELGLRVVTPLTWVLGT